MGFSKLFQLSRFKCGRWVPYDAGDGTWCRMIFEDITILKDASSADFTDQDLLMVWSWSPQKR